MNDQIPETIRARKLRFGMQILEVFAQCKFISPGYHAQKSGNIVLWPQGGTVHLKIKNEVGCVDMELPKFTNEQSNPWVLLQSYTFILEQRDFVYKVKNKKRREEMNTEGTRRAADGTEPEEIIDLTEERDPIIMLLVDKKMEPYLCPICLDPPKQPAATKCGHVFCAKCLIRSLLPTKLCPKCWQRVRSFVGLSLG